MKKTALLLVLVMFSLYAWESVICDAGNLQVFPKVVSDGEGGIIVCFEDNRDVRYEVYVNRVDANGNVLPAWGYTSGICISDNPKVEEQGHRLNSIICDGGNGSAIIGFINYHNISGYSKGIYCQKINKNGIKMWPSNIENPDDRYPIQISSSIFPPSICSDGDGGCVVVVREKRYNAGLKKNEYRIRAWRILSDGTFADDPYYPGWNGKTGIDVVSWTTEVLGDPKAIQKFDFLGNKYKILSGRRMI